MTYEQLLLCYYRQQPFVSLTSTDPRHQLFELSMMEKRVSHFIADLHTCIVPLVRKGLEQEQSLLGFQLGIAEIILEKLQAERMELTAVPSELCLQ